MALNIQRIREEDKDAVLEIVKSFWGDETIVVHDEVFHTNQLGGLKAAEENEIVGILHYRIKGKECEILTLASIKQGKGVGSALIAEVEEIARKRGCRLISVVTTNDNLNALGFYQRRGFHLSALLPGKVIESRRVKPGIPEIGENNIPIRDELRLEKILV